MNSNWIPWLVLGAILILGLVFVMPSVADQIIYHDQCRDKHGVFTYNGKCVLEIPIDRN